MTALQLPAATAIEITAGGPTVRGVRWDWAGPDLSMLFLHAQGGDLDDLRWLADGVVAAGISVLGIDLPGHGLSDGEISADGANAIRAATAELGREATGVIAVLAQGEGAGLLLRTDLPASPSGPPVAAILLDPAPGPRPWLTGQRCAPCWRLVPKLLLVPAGTGHASFVSEVVRSTNAWTLQADLHGFAGQQRPTEIAGIQITSIVLKFVLETAAYELAGRRTGMAPA
jgi:alpha-beta hydrolase superfamily lysophospholipase